MKSRPRFNINAVAKTVVSSVLLAGIVAVAYGTLHYAGRPTQKAELSSESSAEHDSTSDAAHEISFRSIQKDPNPGERMASHLNRVVRIYFRAQAYLQKFDTHLDEATIRKDNFELESQQDYRKLQAARELMERERERIVYYYKRIWEVQRDSKSTRQELNSTLEMNQVIIRMLSESRKTSDRLPFMDLAADLKLSFAQIHKRSDRSIRLPHLAFANAADAKRFYNESMQNEMSLKAQQSETDHEVTGEVEQIALVWSHDDGEPITNERDPQSTNSAKYFPSSAGPGNVNGSGFTNWALTYDDGPHAKNTLAILANLKTYGHRATFFWLASLAPKMPTIVKAVKDAGMDLANHSYSHKQLTKGSTNRALEISKATEMLTKAYGQPVKLFRCPYGACGSNGSSVRSLIAREGMIHVGWNVDSLDWQDKNPASVLARVKKQMASKKGGIILFHDIQPHTVEATRRLMAEFQTKKARLYSVQELLN